MYPHTRSPPTKEFAFSHLRDILNVQNLEDWSTELSRTKRSAADCSHDTQTIRLSKHYLQDLQDRHSIDFNAKDELTKTIYHEVAHAHETVPHIPYRSHHPPEWKKLFSKLIASAVGTKDSSEIEISEYANFINNDYLWYIKCKSCDNVLGKYYRIPKLKSTKCLECQSPDSMYIYDVRNEKYIPHTKGMLNLLFNNNIYILLLVFFYFLFLFLSETYFKKYNSLFKQE